MPLKRPRLSPPNDRRAAGASNKGFTLKGHSQEFKTSACGGATSLFRGTGAGMARVAAECFPGAAAQNIRKFAQLQQRGGETCS